MHDFNELNERLGALEREANAMQCPDCGGLHQCRLSFKDGNILVKFEEGFSGPPCWGYKSFVHQRIRDLKAQYNIPLEP